MKNIIQTITDKELRFISSADYGQDASEHCDALKTVIFHQKGIISNEQYWFPYEVIELCSNSLKENHEREFVMCTLLIILNVSAGTDKTNDLEYKFNSFSSEYDKLSKPLSELIIKEYADASC
jgi:hypothetical protein